MNKKFILASASPRRKQLLDMIGLSYKVVPSKIDERLNPRLKPRSQAEELSLQKALAISKKYPDTIILAADTFVSYKNEILGKPNSIHDAKRMLKKLSGTTHTVITGFTIIDKKSNRKTTKSCETKIVLRKITHKEIDSYLAKENVLDKAGAYAIQGPAAIFIERIEGDYFNIVGLPLYMLVLELKRFGISIL